MKLGPFLRYTDRTRRPMACKPEVLKNVPLFSLLDEEETAVLAGQVEVRNFAPRQRIYKIGDPGARAYVVVSWAFILSFLVILVAYTCVNILLGKSAWDAYPFILLNLFLSMLAALQAPIIMMSQNRQDTKDRLRSELDYEVNRRAEAEIQGLAKKMNLLGDKIGDVEDLLRSKLPA